MFEKFNDNKNVIFKNAEEKEGIESAFVFKDGDILVFKNDTHSTLFDRRDFHNKLELRSVGSAYCFCYLNEEEFVSIKFEYIEFYKFFDDRTKVEKTQQINSSTTFGFQKIIKLSNNDLINLVCINPEKNIEIYQKIDNKYFLSDLPEPITYVDEVVDLGNNEILTKKTDNYKDQLALRIYDTTNYKKLRENIINLIFDERKRIYLTLPFINIENKKKVVSAGISKLFIFNTDDLNLETIINFDKQIINFIQLNNGNLMLMTCIKGNFSGKEREFDRYFLEKIKIDFELNNMLNEEIFEMQDSFCTYKTLTKIGNYINNGLFVIIDNYKIKIFKEC